MKSMTGFGKAVKESAGYQVDIEMKSVNHRFLDIQLRMPKELNTYELAIRKQLKKYASRGRVEVYITVKRQTDQAKQVIVHWSLIEQVMKELENGLSQRFETVEPLSINGMLQQLIANEEFLSVVEQTETESQLEELVLSTLAAAGTALAESRATEGSMIAAVLQDYLHELTGYLKDLQQFVELYETDYRQRFELKLRTWLEDHVAEERLLTEMAILLERGDIHEELDRLSIHLQKAEELVVLESPVGRELDFLIQEMNREVNTIGSKSSPIEIKNLVVQMKTTVEKIREQIQNVE